MPPSSIAPNLRSLIEEDARNRCGYCLTPASFMPVRFEIEHIIPVSAGGETVRSNLWLSCPSCNRFKGIKVEAVDPETQIVVPLFNPRTQNWFEHFQWSEDATRIIGSTAIGRVTIEALKLNHDWWIECRTEWILRGNFPPAQ
jgi:hypothetical protein